MSRVPGLAIDAQLRAPSRPAQSQSLPTALMDEISRLAVLLEHSADCWAPPGAWRAPPRNTGPELGLHVGASDDAVSRLMGLLEGLRGDSGHPSSIPTLAPSQDVGAPIRGVSTVKTRDSRPSLASDRPGANADQLDADAPAPSLMVFFLSEHRVLVEGQCVSEWPTCRGRSIFNYLLTHRRRPTPRDVLMNLFWPDIQSEAARNNLNVAIYGLRKALALVSPGVSYVLFKEGCYLLNPELEIWVDGEAFMRLVARGGELERSGRIDEAMRTYRSAEEMYQSEYLADCPYETWLVEVRSKYGNAFHSITDRLASYYMDQADYESAIAMCRRMLAIDACDEESHRRLIRCYSRIGQHHLALRQYHVCRDSLERELRTPPSIATIRLFEEVKVRRDV